jgi:hypothetical protein
MPTHVSCTGSNNVRGNWMVISSSGKQCVMETLVSYQNALYLDRINRPVWDSIIKYFSFRGFCMHRKKKANSGVKIGSTGTQRKRHKLRFFPSFTLLLFLSSILIYFIFPLLLLSVVSCSYFIKWY